MVWVGNDLIDHLVPTLLPWSRDTFHWTMLLKASSNLALNTAREGAATASLGNLGQGLTTLNVKNFILISNLNVLSFSLKPSPLSYHSRLLSKVPLQLSRRSLQVLEGCCKVSLEPSLLQAEQDGALSKLV